jgi:hypothetical protein
MVMIPLGKFVMENPISWKMPNHFLRVVFITTLPMDTRVLGVVGENLIVLDNLKIYSHI